MRIQILFGVMLLPIGTMRADAFEDYHREKQACPDKAFVRELDEYMANVRNYQLGLRHLDLCLQGQMDSVRIWTANLRKTNAMVRDHVPFMERSIARLPEGELKTKVRFVWERWKRVRASFPFPNELQKVKLGSASQDLREIVTQQGGSQSVKLHRLENVNDLLRRLENEAIASGLRKRSLDERIECLLHSAYLDPATKENLKELRFCIRSLATQDAFFGDKNLDFFEVGLPGCPGPSAARCEEEMEPARCKELMNIHSGTKDRIASNLADCRHALKSL
ncbi:MAG: hypothetical protein HS115_20040 [Spirochaetales bacterium]|nr:hypothetical protein [Spirochaetales bacterium]